MIFFLKVLAFLEIPNIRQKSQDLVVFLRQTDLAFWLFFYLIHQCFILFCTNIHFIKCFFILGIHSKHSCGNRLSLIHSPSPLPSFNKQAGRVQNI